MIKHHTALVDKNLVMTKPVVNVSEYKAVVDLLTWKEQVHSCLASSAKSKDVWIAVWKHLLPAGFRMVLFPSEQ
jgi:hypothetical protein